VACSGVNFTFSVVNSSVTVQCNDEVKRCITGKPRLDSKQRQKLCFCVLLPDRLWGGSGLLSNNCCGLFVGALSQRKRGTDYSSLSSAALRNVWVHTSNPLRFTVTNELTAGSCVFVKLTVPLLVNKFSAFYAPVSRRFITELTKARHLSRS
jgi:hypothetical protein